MGKTWKLGPNALASGELADNWQMELSQEIRPTQLLTGSDIYRLNCRGCHGDSGAGFAPEINSLIDPVRATSPVFITQRMKKAGLSMSRAQAAELAGQAQAALLERLHNGGENMPAFDYLSESEVQLLVSYLRQLAGVPGAFNTQAVVQESSTEIGERIVKSVCHICHDAGGPNPTTQQLENGTIPPLASLTQRTDLAGFVRKVIHGAPIVMGNPPTAHAGRMPVLDYLSEHEVTDVYFYLTLYPPEHSYVDARDARLSANLLAVANHPENAPDPLLGSGPAGTQPETDKTSDLAGFAFIIGAVSMVGLLMIGGAGLTGLCVALATMWIASRDRNSRQALKNIIVKSRGAVTLMPRNARKCGPPDDEVA